MSTPQPSGTPGIKRFLPGLILVALGIIFLLQQFGWELHNWWAVFILIPAFGSFGTAYALFRRSGRLDQAVRGSLFGGLITLMVALMFFLGLDWGDYWPLFLIIPGLSMLLNGVEYFAGERQANPVGRVFQAWAFWVGLGMLYLGGGFLAKNLGIYDPTLLMRRWWALAMLIPAFGGLITSAQFAVECGGLRGRALVTLLMTFAVATPGVVALLGLDWNLINPILLICLGSVLILSYFLGERKTGMD